MPDEKNPRRVYSGADADMLMKASVLQGLFERDLADFTDFDPDFSPEWAAEWAAEIATAYGKPTDETLMDESAGNTEEVAGSMAAARAKWTDVKYFVQKAFPGDGGMLRYFGSAVYGKARRAQPKMIEFLKGLHSACVEHDAALIAAGLSQDDIDEIATIEAVLSEKNNVQNAALRGRPKATAARIAALNAPYLRMARVNRAAQIVFADSYSKRKQYQYGYKPAKKRVKKPKTAPSAAAPTANSGASQSE